MDKNKKMTEKLKETIKEEITGLPKEVQEAINGFDWIKITENIGQEFNLDEDEVTNLQLETLMTLIGVTDLKFYTINIENQVETTKDVATNIAKIALQKIFTPISNLIEENIRRNLKNKNPNAIQTLNFILSGGDYSAFIEPEEQENNTENQKRVVPVFSIK